uniref:Excreted virulence factor EspC (Type VII ESX diderm) n=1 Tax=Salinispora arenicola (strain CNS-205) TaxID=391037 RepID=A8M3S4_SALAI
MDTRALRHFAEVMDQLIAPLNDAWQDLERSGDLAAGRFNKADEISGRAKEARSQYITKIKKFREAYISLRDGMLNLANTYDRAEADSIEAATRANSMITNFKSTMPQG